MTISKRNWFAGAALLALSLGLVAGTVGTAFADEQGGAVAPGFKLNLPPPPSFAEPSTPREYPDGTVSIYGLRKEFHRFNERPNKYIGQNVRVKAYLLEIYQCPACPKGQVCKPCDTPHLFISDEANGSKDKGMLVVEQRAYKEKEPLITPGKQYVFEGNFSTSSPAGFSSSDGLIVLRKLIDDKGKEYQAPLLKQEMEAAKQQAEYEKAMKAKGGQAPVAPAAPVKK